MTQELNDGAWHHVVTTSDRSGGSVYFGDAIFIGTHEGGHTPEQARALYEQACRDIVPDASGNGNHGRMHSG